MVSMTPNGTMPNTMNYFGGNPGYGYNNNVAPIKPTQTLTPEQIAMLTMNGGPFKLELTQEEILRGICFHRDAQGNHTLIDNGDGTITCSICGKTMPLTPFTKEEVQASVKNICDVLQWIKLLYINMPTQTAQEFFQIIPMLEKVDKLFEMASNIFKSQENGQGLLTPNMGINPFAILAGIMNPGVMGMPNMGMMGSMMPGGQMWNGQTQWGPQAQMPGMQPNMMGAQPQGAWGMPGQAPQWGMDPNAANQAWGAAAGNPQWGGSNGFGFYGNPNAQQMPGANVGYAYTPGAQTQGAPAANPAQPAGAAGAPQVGGAPQAQTATTNPDGSTTVNTQFHP